MWVFNFFNSFFGFHLFDMLVRIITVFPSALLFMLEYIEYIFWNTNQASLGSILCSLLCLRHDTYIIPFIDVIISLWFWTIFVYLSNDFMGIQNCRLLCNIIDNIYLPYKMDHLLKLCCEAVCILWQYMCTVHLFCHHNVLFFIYEEVSWYSDLVFDCFRPNYSSNYFLINISNWY